MRDGSGPAIQITHTHTRVTDSPKAQHTQSHKCIHSSHTESKIYVVDTNAHRSKQELITHTRSRAHRGFPISHGVNHTDLICWIHAQTHYQCLFFPNPVQSHLIKVSFIMLFL